MRTHKIEVQYQAEPNLQVLVDNIFQTIEIICVLSDIFDGELHGVSCINSNGIVELIYKLVTLWSDRCGSCCTCDGFFTWDNLDQLVQKINEHLSCAK